MTHLRCRQSANPPRRHSVAEPQPNPKPTTEALRHGEKPEKTSCTAEARRRGEEFDFDENLRKKRGNLGLVIRRHGEKPKKPVAPRRRGEEFHFDGKFAQKTRKFGISNT